MSDGPPLPVPREEPHAVRLTAAVELVETESDGGTVFVWGNAAWSWLPGDAVGRRLAAVQLVGTGMASNREAAEAFSVTETTLWRWRRSYGAEGVAGLATRRRGPRGPSRLTAGKIAEIVAARAEGLSMAAIAARVGVSLNSVSRALRAERGPTGRTDAAGEQPVGSGVASGPVRDGQLDGAAEGGGQLDGTARGGGQLVVLARPEGREVERQQARAGLLDEAPPQVCEGASLPLAGALTILPALAVTGLLDAFEEVYAGTRRASFYGLRSLVLTMVFAGLVGQPRVEGLSRLDPTDVGRLLGLDRAPEVKTLRRRLAELATAGRADRLLAALARRHVEAHPDQVGLLYVDGHVRAYHGVADVPKHHLARMRISMPAEEDIWVADATGDGLLVWQAPPGASLVGELRVVVDKVRELLGPGKRPTICFDRGGWSPRLFTDLDGAGFDVLTYRKGVKTPEPDDAFTVRTFTDPAGRVHVYELADRPITLTCDAGRTTLPCRQITRRTGDGHQTQIVTTRSDADPAPLAYAMFSRWRQENFFRYMRHRYALDALDAYTTVADDPDRDIPNPAKKAARERVAALDDGIIAAQADHDRHSTRGVPDGVTGDLDRLATEITAVQAERDQLAAVPARTTIGQARPDSRRLDPERKRLHDAVRLATYNAETGLVRLLADHYPRADHEARTLLAETFTAPADLRITRDELHVTINPLSAPRRTRALARLCHDLTATRATYPGTNLTLVYTVKTP